MYIKDQTTSQNKELSAVALPDRNKQNEPKHPWRELAVFVLWTSYSLVFLTEHLHCQLISSDTVFAHKLLNTQDIHGAQDTLLRNAGAQGGITILEMYNSCLSHLFSHQHKSMEGNMNVDRNRLLKYSENTGMTKT